jgi:hypothetical protein
MLQKVKIKQDETRFTILSLNETQQSQATGLYFQCYKCSGGPMPEYQIQGQPIYDPTTDLFKRTMMMGYCTQIYALPVLLVYYGRICFPSKL